MDWMMNNLAIILVLGALGTSLTHVYLYKYSSISSKKRRRSYQYYLVRWQTETSSISVDSNMMFVDIDYSRVL
jgi:hypothetical protein